MGNAHRSITCICKAKRERGRIFARSSNTTSNQRANILCYVMELSEKVFLRRKKVKVKHCSSISILATTKKTFLFHFIFVVFFICLFIHFCKWACKSLFDAKTKGSPFDAMLCAPSAHVVNPLNAYVNMIALKYFPNYNSCWSHNLSFQWEKISLCFVFFSFKQLFNNILRPIQFYL